MRQHDIVVSYDISIDESKFSQALHTLLVEKYEAVQITKSNYLIAGKFFDDEMASLQDEILDLHKSKLDEQRAVKETKVVIIRGTKDRRLQYRTIIHEVNGSSQLKNSEWLPKLTQI